MRRLAAALFLSMVVTGATIYSACNDKKNNPEPSDGNYPPEISDILIKKCATSGCHTTASKDAAAGLDLSTWDNLFLGTRNGAAAIPYRSDQSTLFYFVNTDTTLGITQLPTMPYNQTPLTTSEILTIRNWIDNGAPDKYGNIKFSDNPNRRKIYISNQGCDLVGVHDPVTRVVMRYVEVGNSPSIESPHQIKLSPDGQYWYAIGIAGNFLQRYRTSDDAYVDEATIGFGYWNTFTISPDGTKAWVIDLNANGRIAYVNLTTMSFVMYYTDPGMFSSPHGSFIDPTGHYLYVTNQLGNSVYKWDVSDPLLPSYDNIIINNSATPADPHEILFSPDGSKYFVTCQNLNQVRVMDVATDTLVAVIPTADYPLEMSISPSHGYLFVSCMTANSVTVIDINNLTAIKTIFTGYDPHGLVVDEQEDVVYVANRNLPTSGGPPPHHISECGGRNGYMTVIKMSSLELEAGFKSELSVDPYSVILRN
ncbi:MAG TPA: beta-propeller fold lactonase family protein [Bacteroidia bacterium]|nr:beta-propeller fold lactonase family protein [Bacteroidia bacterium]